MASSNTASNITKIWTWNPLPAEFVIGVNVVIIVIILAPQWNTLMGEDLEWFNTAEIFFIGKLNYEESQN